MQPSPDPPHERPGHPVPAEPPPSPARRAWGPIAAAGGFALLKAKSALLLLKGLSFGKLALTGLSMGAMIWFEARRGGVPFGVGFVLLILVHELGHGFAMRRAGVEASWPVFIPFFGAMIAMKGRPASSAVEAEIAYGGPLAGTAASLLCAAGYLLFDSRLLLALAYTGFFLNLFNLVPVSPLDGGRVAQAFSRRAWIVGGLLLGGMFLATHTPQLLFIGVLAAMHAIRGGGTPHEVPATPEEQRAWTTRYFGLCFFLGAAMWFARQLLIPGAT